MMIYLILGVAIVATIIKISDMNTGLKILETEVAELKKKINVQNVQNVPPNVSNATQNIQNSSPVVSDTNVEVLKATENLPTEDHTSGSSDISNWFKENFIIKVGIILILAGFGWFVSYAFANNWVGPEMRIALGSILGVLFTIFGTIRLGKNRVQGIAFTVLGSALVIITILAGQYFYNFFSPFIVLAIIFFVSLYVSVSAVYRSMEDLTVFALIVSLFAPYVSHTSGMDPVILYFYLFVISAGTIWVSILKNWRKTTLISVTGVLLYSLPYFWSHNIDESAKYIVLMIAYIMSIFYMAVNIFSIIKNQLKVEVSDIYLSILNTLVVIGFTLSFIDKSYQSIVFLAWTVVYAVSGFLVYIKTKNVQMFYIHTLITTLLLAIATSIEYGGQTLVIAFAFEAAIIAISSFIVTRNIVVAESFALLTFAPGLLSLPSLVSSKWDAGIFHSDFFVLVTMAFVLSAMAVFYMINKDSENEEFKVHHVLFIASSFYIYAIIWLSSPILFMNKDFGVFASLFIFTIIGLISHFIGLFKHHIVLKNYGIVLLVLVVARLILVDVWKMEMTLRIVTFLVLGIMFISTAFISKSQNKTVSNV